MTCLLYNKELRSKILEEFYRKWHLLTPHWFMTLEYLMSGPLQYLNKRSSNLLILTDYFQGIDYGDRYEVRSFHQAPFVPLLGMCLLKNSFMSTNDTPTVAWANKEDSRCYYLKRLRILLLFDFAKLKEY